MLIIFINSEECQIMKKLAIIGLLTMFVQFGRAQFQFAEPLAHTFSIVARDSITGEMGVAVQSHWFSVGSVVSWAEAGVGAVATQSFVNVSFGPRGIDLLKQGNTAGEALDRLIASDEGRDFRQLAIVDAKGNVAVYTGPKCIPDAGHEAGGQFSVQANLMLNDRIWPAMAGAYRKAEGPLAERMVAVLEAAQIEGGDIRGKQSAAILVVRGESTGKVWEDRLIDLRVEDHPDPIREIKRLLKVYRAYEYMNQGDLAMEKNDVENALRLYGTAEGMFPENLEMKFWHAVSLANINRIDEARSIFQDIFARDPNWKVLTERLPGVGLLNIEPKKLKKIISE
jgi:uncharacterized Ntn-hydrolase superfamily protein